MTVRVSGAAFALVLLSLSSAAFGQTVCNPAPITIPDIGTAAPYPSSIVVAGLPPSIITVDVTLNSFSHTFPDDVGAVIVGPGGQAFLLQDGAGDDPDMVNITYALSNSGATQLPDLTAWAAGTYRPAGYYSGDPFPAPGPGTTYAHPGPAGGNTATLNGTYSGTNPNGTWSLFVVDFVASDSGSFSGGWCVTFTAVPVELQGFSVE